MGDFRRRIRLLSAGKSPSTECMKRTYRRAVLNGGVTQDFSANVENIREICRKLNYVDGNVFFRDAPFVYVPSSYGEGKNFAQVHNKRNLLQWSEEFDNAIWVKNNVTISANSTTAPNGTLTADTLSLNGTATVSPRRVRHAISLPAQTLTASIYAKKKDLDRVLVNINGALSNGSIFDLTNGTVVSNTGTVVSSSIVDAGNGWWRCSVTSNVAITFMDFFLADSSTGIVINNTNTSGIYIWGAQLELGVYVTPYQKTVASGDGIVDFNFTRATGNAKTTNKQGVIEDSCYNLIQQSETLTNGAWGVQSVTAVLNTNTNPFGVNKSFYINDGTATASKYIGSRATMISGVTYTMSFYVKKADFSWIQFSTGGGNFPAIWKNFNFDTGSFGNGVGIGIWNSIELINGYWLITVTATANASSFDFTGVIFSTNNTNSVSKQPSYTGTNKNIVDCAAMQTVQGSTPRPYLKTTNRLNVPRLDYSRGLGEPELLIERASTNMIISTEDFSQSRWFFNDASFQTNTNLNPFGVNKSTYVIENSNNALHRMWHNPQGTLTTGLVYSVSWYVKKAQDSWICLSPSLVGFGATVWINFNFDIGAFGNAGGGGTWDKKLLINGYWKITCTATSLVTSFPNLVQIGGTNNTDSVVGFPIYTGVVGHQIADVAAIQFEAGSNATTYIPTTTATVTRNAETSYVDLWNNALLNRTNWTLFWEGYLYDGQTTGMSLCLSDTSTAASNTNQIGWYSKLQPFYNIGNTRSNTADVVNNNSIGKLAIQYNNGLANFWVSGIKVFSELAVPSFDYRYLIANSGNSTYLTDKIALFNRTLTDTECHDLTVGGGTIALSAPNTFIGGVASTLNTVSLVAAKLGIGTNRIHSLNIVGSDIEFCVIGTYTIPANAFQNNTLITTYLDNSGLVTSLGTNSFRSSTIQQGYFPSITTIQGTNITNSGAFDTASGLTSLYAPNLTTIGFRGLINCSSLLFLDVSKLTSVANFSLNGLTNVVFNSFSALVTLNTSITGATVNTIFDFPLLQSTHNIGGVGGIFSGNTAATTYNFPALTFLGASQGGFNNNSNLETLSMPLLTTWTSSDNAQSPNVSLGIFVGSKVKSISCPLLTTFEIPSAFQNTTFMETINMPALQKMGYDVTTHNLFFAGIKLGCAITTGSGNLTVNSGSENDNLVWVKANRAATVTYV